MKTHQRKEYFDTEGRLLVKPYRMTDFCHIFDVHYKTLRAWMKAHEAVIGERQGRYYSIGQVETMLNIFGWPHIGPVAPVQKTIS